ncbi:MAG: glycosyltransferase [Clostridia bacterium]|nr:glycosyltransferase [Clostridia bacterium]
MEVRLYALLVIYNRACEDSPSVMQLAASPEARAVIVDNSTEPNRNAAFCAARGFGYISMGGNLGLVKAYNRGLAFLKAHTDATHAVLLDDDTTLPDNFREEMTAAVERHGESDVFLPRVYDEKGLLSPCRIEGLRVSRVDDPSELTRETLTGINSGMTVALSLFTDYAYDEGYFLDYIDHAFLRDMKKRDVLFTVTRLTLRQRFAANARGARKAARIRFRIFKKDFRRFCGPSFKGRLTAEAVIMRRRIRVWLSR